MPREITIYRGDNTPVRLGTEMGAQFAKRFWRRKHDQPVKLSQIRRGINSFSEVAREFFFCKQVEIRLFKRRFARNALLAFADAPGP